MVINKTVLTLLTTLWLNTLLSQSVFDIALPLNQSRLSQPVITKDSSYVIFTTQSGLYSVGGTLYTINKQGKIDSLYLPKLKTEVSYTILNSKDGYIIAGETHDEIIDDGIGYADFIAEKIDFEGNIVWQLPLAGTSMKDAIATSDGNFLIMGTINEQLNSGREDVVIYKINEDGELLWQKIIGKKFVGIHDDTYSDEPKFIQEIDNNYYLSYDVYKNASKLVKLDELGSVSWSNSTPTSIVAIFKLNNKTYFASNKYNVFELNKFNGNYLKINKEIRASSLGVYRINYENTCNELTVIERLDNGFYLNKYKNIEKPYSSIKLKDGYESVYIKKTLDNGYIYARGPNIFIKSDCLGNHDFWDSECTNRLKDNNSVIIYPNPTTKYINIETDFKITKVIVIDPIGKELVLNNYCNCNIQKIDVSIYSQGTYFLKVIGEYSSEIVKFLKY